jgi:hypothetical protein
MGPEYVPQYDEPDIMIRVDAEAGTLKEVEFSKMSKWRGRILTSANSLTPAGVLIDRALTDKSSGGAEVGELNMTAWKMIDMVGSKPFLGARAATEADLKEKILLPDAAGKTVKTYEIDMRGFYEKLGIITYPPAFAEYVMPPLSWLFQADEPVENYIATRANLTKEQRLQAIPTIRISHNWNKLRRLLSAKQLPVDFERMSKIAAATIGYVQ